MKRSRLRIPAASREMIDTFGGYDHNRRIPDGAFYDMKNLSADGYPLMSPRKPRGIYARPECPGGMICKDALCYIDGRNFVINQYPVDLELTPGRKQLVSMGARVVIFPDKKYINTQNLADFGSLEASYTGAVTFTPCMLDGSGYTVSYEADTEPETPKNGEIWLDTSQTPRVLKKWSEASGMWVSGESTYVKLSAAGIGAHFCQYDGVEITGLSEGSELKQLEGSQVIWTRDADFIVVSGLISGAHTCGEGVSICRRVPDMDYVVQCNNRLWGCRYGIQTYGGREEKGETVNVIYCSKLGDEKNWSCFMGTAMDSWYGNLGTDGQFTGAINYLGYPMFFKENFLHKVYVSSEGAHQVADLALRGVQAGCEKSLAMVGEVLYYKSRGGVCAYDGSLPGEISQSLGQIAYDRAVAGVLGNKYYISMRQQQGQGYVLFVYDTQRGLWHKEDDLQAADFCSCGGELYCIEETTGRILTMGGSGEEKEGPVCWMGETGLIGLSLPDRKYVNQLQLRLYVPPGAALTLWAQYDSVGSWERLFQIQEHGTGSFCVHIRPVRCDHMRLRLEGTGDIRVYSITKQILRGSERP